MSHYGMDVLRAAKLFWKYAQETGVKSQLIGLSNKLANPIPVASPDQSIDTSLISTLQQEVNQMDEQERFPISRSESKSAVRNLYNAVKLFHSNLVKPSTATTVPTKEQNITKTNNLISDFQRVRNEWDNYRRSYLSEYFLNELQLAKSETDVSQQQEFENRFQFWKAFIKATEETITAIEKLLKDQLTGNPETPLEATPV